MISVILSRIIILLFGTLYPAYASYKAVRTKDVKKYVQWMMYWIVFALFTCIETFTDIFLSWFPFYYEIKIIIVIWLLSPATNGSSMLYRKIVHPVLTKRETEIDDYLNQAKEKGYSTVLQLGSKGVNYATSVIMQTAIKGGGNLVQTLRKSYSLSDLSEPDIHRSQDELDEIVRVPKSTRSLRPRPQSLRSSSSESKQVDMYFAEMDVARKRNLTPNYNYVRSSEDISSGYSSAEPVSLGLSRTASMTNATRSRIKAKRNEDEIESSYDGDEVFFAYSSCYESGSEFQDRYRNNSLNSISEIQDEEADFIPATIQQRKSSKSEVDPRYELFLKWLESQGNAQKREQSFESDDYRDAENVSTHSSDDFHDVEKEKEEIIEEPKSEKELVSEEVKEKDTIPGILETLLIEPPRPAEVEKGCPDSLEALIIPTAIPTPPPKKLHSPNKGRAPNPPSPISLSKSTDSLTDHPAPIQHKETSI